MKTLELGLLLVIFGCATSSPSEDGGGDTGAAGLGGDGGGEATGGGDTTSDGGASSSGGASVEFCAWDACGGDPFGHWVYTKTCLPDAPVPGACEGSATEYLFYLTGTLDLYPDGTLLVDTTAVQDTVIYYPKSCWPPFATQCEDFVHAEGLDLSCVNTPKDCTCTVNSTMVNGPSADTYIVQDDHLVTGDGTDFTFCVDADHLVLIHDTGERTYLDRATE